MSQEPRILEKRLYTATATATGGRDGVVRTDDGALDLTIVPPAIMVSPRTGLDTACSLDSLLVESDSPCRSGRKPA